MKFREFAKSLEIGEEDYLELLNLFIKTAASELTNLESALEKRDVPVIERMAHSIKGAAGILGLAEIHDAAKRIEMAAGMNRLEEVDLQVIKKKIETIDEALKRRS